MIELINVSKIFNKGTAGQVSALQDITLTINDGDMIAVTGPSGSGKSTLLHVIAGLLDVSSGDVIVDGRSLIKMNDREKCRLRNSKLGIVMQDYGLLESDTVIRNVCLPLIIAGNYNKESHERACGLLKQMGIEDLMKKKVSPLSGGQKQRVAIARALATGAKTILADEPTGALDNENTVRLMELLGELNDSGITIVVVTHDKAVSDYCRKEYRIIDGRIQ